MNKEQYQQLANQFIEMWQQQMQSVLTDKDFIQSMLSGLQHMANVATPQAYDVSKYNTRAATPGAAAAPDDVAQLLGQLDYRLRMVEARLSKLEASGSRKTRAKPTARAGGKSGDKPIRKPAKRR